MTESGDMDAADLAAKRAKMPKSELKKYNRIMIANGDIYTYDEDYKTVEPQTWLKAGMTTPCKAITGRRIRSALQVDKSFTYTISDNRQGWDNKT